MLGDYAEEHGPNTAAPERVAYAIAPLASFWEGRTAAEITKESCAAYRRQRARADGTVRRELGVLRAALGHAYGEGRLTRLVPVPLPPKGEPRERCMTKSEAALLLRASLRSPKPRLYLPLFIVIGLHTGARKEAILSLRWNQIDLEAGTIAWNPADRVQTKKRRPRARIPRKLLGHLRRARRRGHDIGPVIHDGGRPLGDIKKAFASAAARAGLEGVTPHVMRHTRATWGMRAGANVWELGGFLGMSPETLQRVYGHHHPDYQKHAAEAY